MRAWFGPDQRLPQAMSGSEGTIRVWNEPLWAAHTYIMSSSRSRTGHGSQAIFMANSQHNHLSSHSRVASRRPAQRAPRRGGPIAFRKHPYKVEGGTQNDPLDETLAFLSFRNGAFRFA